MMGSLNIPNLDRSIATVVEDSKIIVTVGSGGVGKTTSAAALGLYGSHLGKRTLVITIDPAHRLANALGLRTLSYSPQLLAEEIISQAPFACPAPVSAMMLDLKAAWDDLIRRASPSSNKTNEILRNPIYGHVSENLPGAQEFIACETLFTLHDSGAYDLIILDTPPTTNALDFLDSPERILNMLENDAFNHFFKEEKSLSQKIGLRFLDFAGTTAQNVLSKFTGMTFLDNLAEFLHLFRDIYPTMSRRTRQFFDLLKSPSAQFLVITSPAPAPLSEANFFLDELRARKHPVGAVVCNRMHFMPRKSWRTDIPKLLPSTQEGTSPVSQNLQDIASRLCQDQEDRADADLQAITPLFERLQNDIPMVCIPRMSVDVHDIQSLGHLVPWLVGDEGLF